MKVKEAITELWKIGFFSNYRTIDRINQKLFKKYGITCSNTIMILKLCKGFLRKDKKGWVQKTKYSEEEQNASKKESLIKNLLNNKSLWTACRTSFEGGDYWDACLHALRHLETKIRGKCNLPAGRHGVDLIDAAFNPQHGILKIPSCAEVSEEEGFCLINRGIFMFHRNPKGHREGAIEMNDAIKIICYVDYILDVINTAQRRTAQ